MTATVVMYDKSYDYIRPQLDALGLDVTVGTFDKNGTLTLNGAAVEPGETDVDYFWLSSHLNADKAGPVAFELAQTCRSVKVLQTFNAGLDNPAYKKISDRGTRICNSSAQGVAIAEYVMAQALSVIHPIDQQRAQQAAREWKITPFRELSRMNWLIVGYGPIGKEITKRVKAFDASVTVVRRSPATSDLVDRAGTQADLPGLLPDADVIVLACPLNDDTRGMADETFFAAVKPGAVLINIARGKLIDDAAMLAALDGGRLATAILDVYHTEPLPTDDPLWAHPNVRMTPHTSFAGDGARARSDALFTDNIQRFMNGGPLHMEVAPADIG